MTPDEFAVEIAQPRQFKKRCTEARIPLAEVDALIGDPRATTSDLPAGARLRFCGVAVFAGPDHERRFVCVDDDDD